MSEWTEQRSEPSVDSLQTSENPDKKFHFGTFFVPSEIFWYNILLVVTCNELFFLV